VLALEAATRLSGIKRLALYEAPFIVDNSRVTTEGDWTQIREAVATNRRSDAVRFFLKAVGLPTLAIALMRLTPVWSKLKAVAPTIPYDGTIVEDNQKGKPLPAHRWVAVTAPTLIMDGGKSPAWIRHANQSLASVVQDSQYRTLEGQTHMVNAKVQTPILVEFFNGENALREFALGPASLAVK
jgi:hypothetical protein